MKIKALVLCLALIVTVLAWRSWAIQLTSQTMQLKKGNMLGSVGITMAQWDLEFDQDLYYFEAPPCAPGLTRQNLTSTYVAADPCWAGCDFTSSDPSECGRPFNTLDPACQAICDAHPKKTTLCDFENRPWTVIEPDVESPVLDIKLNEIARIRFNWLRVEEGFRFESMPIAGPVSFTGFATMDHAAKIDGDAHCLNRQSPSAFVNVCPSSQCFYYGTWELSIESVTTMIVTDYSGSSTHIVRTFPAPGSVRLTAPRADAPATFPVNYTAVHTPLQFGVTQNVRFPANVRGLLFQLTTPYCGFINIQHEKAVWNRPTARVAVSASTDGKPIPTDLTTDIFFLDGALKPLWICPRAPQTNATVFLAVLRYSNSGDPLLSYPELHYLTVDYYRESDQWKKFRLGATAAESGYSNHTNFPPLANWNNGLAANLFRLSCPNPASPNTSVEYYDCRAGSASYSTCVEFLFGVPADPWTISLLPVPTVVRSINPEGFGNIQYSAFQQTASRRLSAFLILELTSDGAVISQTLGSDWERLWPRCVLHSGAASPVASLDAEWFYADVALAQETVPTCVYSEFEQLSQQIAAGIDAMSGDPLSAYSERVLIDELTFREPWQACTRFIASELSSTYSANVSVYSSVACLDDSNTDDPCCNNDLSWTQCCAARDFSAVVDALELDAQLTNDTCQFPTCVEPLLDEYYRSLLLDQTGGCAGPDLNSKLRAPIRIYRQCREAAFGDDFVLRSCVLDSDCASLSTATGNTSTFCNQVTKQCAFNFSASVAYFFECIADHLPIEARIKLIELNDFEITDAQPLAALLQHRYGRSTECVDTSFGAPWSDSNEFLQTQGLFADCPACVHSATDVSYQPPPWCEVRSGSRCSYSWIPQTSSVLCETQVCNWDQSDSCNTALLGTSFCGVCESDAICTQVSTATSKTACEDDIPSVCFLADGTVRTDLTESQCAEQYSCTLNCSGGACLSQDACEGTGYCEPDEEIYEAMEATVWNTANITGFCTVPLSPFNRPDCATAYLGSLPSSYGCVVFATCVVSPSGTLTCVSNYYTQRLCALLPNSTWWPRYDKASCQSGKSGCSEQLLEVQSLSSLGTLLRSPKDDEQCSMCGGEIEELASWVSGLWLPGTSRSPQWIERAMATRYELSESVDFNTLYDDIYTASRAAVAFQLQNNIQCSYQTVNTLIAKVSCACTTDLSRAECFSGAYITNVGQGEACPQTSNTITAPPATLSYTEESVSSELQNQCVEFDIERINAQYFYGEAPPPISTGFVPTFTIRGWNAVVNEQDAVVGQVIGDGIQIHFTQNGKYLSGLEVCMQISTSISLSDTEPFTVYGLGYWTSSDNPAKVVPYRGLANVSVDDGYVCAAVHLPQTGEDVSFVPIYYRKDWQEQPSMRFSSGQKALLYIVATLYAILCFAIVVQLIRLIAVGAWDFTVPTNYMWLLLFFMTIIRAIYIYLVAGNSLGQQNMHLLVDFWMMDLPTLLWLICNSTIALSFLFLLLASKSQEFQRPLYFWVTLGVLVSFIVAIFVAVLLAFNYAVVNTQGVHGPALCSTYTDNSSAASTIRIVYECLLFAIALAIALIGGLIAAKLWWGLRDNDGTASLLILGCVSSFGILADSLAFLIYYIVNNPTPYFAIVLIFTEILPVAVLVARVSTKQIKNKKRSSEESPKHGTRGHSYSTTPPATYETPWTTSR